MNGANVQEPSFFLPCSSQLPCGAFHCQRPELLGGLVLGTQRPDRAGHCTEAPTLSVEQEALAREAQVSEPLASKQSMNN